MNTLFLLLLSVVPVNDDLVFSEHFDRVEVNHHYDPNGKLLFDQVIWYNWNHTICRYEVIDYRMVKGNSLYPKYHSQKQQHISTFLEGEILREISADSYIETWTQYDPEFLERDILAKERRKLLSQPRTNNGNSHRQSIWWAGDR